MSQPVIVGSSFAEPVFDSQRDFHTLMHAMAAPGTPAQLPALPQPPARLCAATAAVALTLFDAETTIWLARVEEELERWLKFHCGCPVVYGDEGQQAADFALLTDSRQLPWQHFRRGSAEGPDRSTTLVVQVSSFDGPGFRATGPGIETTATFAATGLPAGLLEFMDANHTIYPAGVDAILTTGGRILCLPRTTTVTAEEDQHVCCS